MRVFRGLDELPPFHKPVVTIGTFDGVHIGHRAIIQQIIAKAREVNGESILVTFEPHPRMVIGVSEKPISLLQTLEEKIAALQQLDIDNLVVVPFTKAFSEISASDYIKDFLVRHFHPHTLVIGYDHRFGNQRNGDFNMLERMKQEYHYILEEIPMKEIENSAVSSTRIRQALAAGDVQKAALYLTRPYTLSGQVQQGAQIGRTLGFPTANILPDSEQKLIPAIGVYAVNVFHHGQSYQGMLNIGFRPTVTQSNQAAIEVHLFDFNQTIYGEHLQIEFMARLRDEQKFASLEELTSQLASDREQAIRLLNKV